MTLINHNAFNIETQPKPQSLLARIRARGNVWRQRRALSRLSYAALLDIGYSRKEAMSEARRPFWDVPSYWRR